MFFIQMHAALREYHRYVVDLAQSKFPGVTRHRRLRQIRELRVRDRLDVVRHNPAQTRAKNNGKLRPPIAQRSGRVVHAAETGGAVGGLRRSAIASGRTPSSRTAVSFVSRGYAMRLCNIDMSVKRKRSLITFTSPSVRSQSSSWPSAIRSSINSLTSCSIRCGVGFSKLRDALSTISARLTIALSFVCGFGPG